MLIIDWYICNVLILVEKEVKDDSHDENDMRRTVCLSSVDDNAVRMSMSTVT